MARATADTSGDGNDASAMGSYISLAEVDLEKPADRSSKSITGDRGQGGAEAELADENLVGWDDNDPVNPHNWPASKKYLHCGMLSFLSFVTPLASSICAPGIPQLMAEFDSSSPELAAFVVSVYVLGFAIGPLLFAPLSEIYGRAVTYHICNLGFVCFLVACALAPSIGSLVAFRLLSGIFGSCPLANAGGSVADMVPAPEQRGAFMAALSIGPLLGPIIGPVAGSFLSAAMGWRWVFWLLVILAGALGLAMLLLMRETYAPVILQRRTVRLRRQTGNGLLRSRLDDGLSPADRFSKAIVRPLKLLVLSPISLIFAIYMAIVYGYLYLMFTTITEVFEGYYNFSPNIVGLAFLGLGTGSFLGVVVSGAASDRHLKRQAASGREARPEDRLQLVPLGAVLLPAGLFVYGWTAEYHVHWIVPMLGMALVGAGNMLVFMALVLYLVDAFGVYAASALAANSFIRSIAGALLPLAGLKMFDVLGVGWGNSLLGFIAAAMIPVPFLFRKYGEWLRKRFEVKGL